MFAWNKVYTMNSASSFVQGLVKMERIAGRTDREGTSMWVVGSQKRGVVEEGPGVVWQGREYGYP